MIPTRYALAFAASFAASFSALAHTEIPSAEWCADGTVMYVDDFALTRDQLQATAAQRRSTALILCEAQLDPPRSSGDGHCGIFDDPAYEMALAAARAACGESEFPMPSRDSPIVAVITHPPSFNAADHHETFNFDAGVSGMCGICVPQSTITPPVGLPTIAPPIAPLPIAVPIAPLPIALPTVPPRWP